MSISEVGKLGVMAGLYNTLEPIRAMSTQHEMGGRGGEASSSIRHFGRASLDPHSLCRTTPGPVDRRPVWSGATWDGPLAITLATQDTKSPGGRNSFVSAYLTAIHVQLS